MPKGIYERSPLRLQQLTIQVMNIPRRTHHSAASKIKCSLAQMGNKKALGKPKSQEHKDKIRIANTGKVSPTKGMKFSEEIRKRMSIAQRKSKKASVVYKRSMRVRRSLRYRLVRESVFKRDDYTCQECRKKGGKINMHHIKSFSQYIHLRFVLSNLVTLCEPCHKLTDNFGFKALKI